MSDIDDEELDKLIDGILGRCPGYGRGQIKDALDRLGHRVCRQRIAAAKKGVNGPNLTFGQRPARPEELRRARCQLYVAPWW